MQLQIFGDPNYLEKNQIQFYDGSFVPMAQPFGDSVVEQQGGITSLPIDPGAVALGEMRDFPIRRNPALFKTPQPFVNEGAVDLAEMDQGEITAPADDPNLMLSNLEQGRPERFSTFTTGDVVPDTVDSLFFKRGENTEGGFKGVVPALLNSILPFDNRVRDIQDFYGSRFGLDNIGRIASGPLKGYNPVSGGLLYGLTGGRVGQSTNIGLQRALEEKIARRTSKKTLDRIKNLKDAKRRQRFLDKTKGLEDLLKDERQFRIDTAPRDVRQQIERNRELDRQNPERFGLL